jgi:hypothetical protein
MNCMGLFGWKRHDRFESAVSRSFSNLKRDMDLQRRWLGYLNHLHTTLSQTHHSHRQVTEQDVSSIRKWVEHLAKGQEKHEEALLRFERDMRETINAYNRHLEHIYSQIKQAAERDSAIRDEILKEVGRIAQPRIEQKAVTAPERSLSNPEQKLLNLLLSESDPVSYSHIAQKTGNSINTVRVLMNSLKKQGLVDEHALPSGQKLWSAAGIERVKKLYNLQS